MKFAAVFPGQGSQSVGMLAKLAAELPVVRDTFAEAADVLGYDLWSLAQSGPEERLKQTEITQPLMFVSGVACWRAWRERGGPLPSCTAGHSLGEYAALVAAETFAFADGLRVVALRGDLMSRAVPDGEGGMAAILGLDDDTVIALCESLTGARVVEAVNFNAPSQVVISGHVDALEQACDKAKEAGAKRALMLAVSVPNHSSLMQGVVEPLAAAIAGVPSSQPVVPILQNADASEPDGLDALLTSLKAHVANPVRWTGTLQAMRKRGIDAVVEFGPGKVLSGLAKRTDRGFALYAVDEPDSLQAALDAVASAEVSS
ncbi:MAG: ACP S-malonyltransferase [Pseudomonadota bacterium]